MVKALSTDGISGYVYARELVTDITDITDITDLTNLTNDVRFINLYDADGITVIGEFQIG